MKGLAWGLTLSFLGAFLVIVSMTLWGFARKLTPRESEKTEPALSGRIRKLRRAQTICQISGIVLILLGVVTGVLLQFL